MYWEVYTVCQQISNKKIPVFKGHLETASTVTQPGVNFKRLPGGSGLKQNKNLDHSVMAPTVSLVCVFSRALAALPLRCFHASINVIFLSQAFLE